jgi:putative ABC transport system substrate-binding protein
MSPNVTRVALLDGDAKAVIGQAARDAARGLDITLISTKIDSIANLASAFDNAVRAGANAILVADWPQMHWPELQRAIHALAIRHRLPAIHSVLSAADTGALLVYASDILDNYRRAPHFVDRILRGAKPSDLPVEQPTRFHLVVNRKAAGAIGLSIPASILAEAEREIQ